MTLAKKLKLLLADRETSGKAMARRLGVSQSLAWRWTAGASLPTVPQVLALARLFDVPPGWLIDEALDYPPPASAVPVPAGPADDGEDLTPFFPATDLSPRGNHGGRRGA